MEEEKSKNEATQPPTLFGRRHLLVLLSFFGLFHGSLIRANMGVAVVAMTTNQTFDDGHGNETFVPAEFHWSSEQESLLLASFFYGFFVTQWVGGVAAPIIGGGRLVGLAMTASAILSIVTPFFAHLGYVTFFTARTLTGLIQGFVFPSIHELWRHWAPPLESTKILSIIYSGSYVGSVCGMAFGGVIANFLGWPWIFYLSGASALLWSLTWFSIVKEEPSKDKHVSAAELHYLTTNVIKTQRARFSDTPWRLIFTSLPVWAAIISCSAESYTYYLLMTQLPQYLSDTTDLNIENLGILSSLPYLAMAITAQFSGFIADTLRSKYKIPTTIVRKVSTCGAYFVQAIVLASISYIDSLAGIMVCLIIVLGVSGCSCFTINFFDLAPKYASLIVGIANGIASIAGLISPTITGFIVEHRLKSEWQIVFFIATGVAAFGSTFYGLFGSGELQPWAVEETDKSPEENPVSEEPVLYKINPIFEMEEETREEKESE